MRNHGRTLLGCELAVGYFIHVFKIKSSHAEFFYNVLGAGGHTMILIVGLYARP